jgi:4-hydroxy-4-methyl-2-oxoglutarate aldolase
MSDDNNLMSRLQRLHTALLADVMDHLGFRDSALGPDIRPMEPQQTVVGRAFTMRCEALEEPAEKPYEHLLAAYEDIGEGDVIVLHCADRVSAMWGELLSTAAKAKGAVGVVMDGVTRDVVQTLEVGFPVFSVGYSPLDSSGRQEVVDHGQTMTCGLATVHPGDWIVGDIMGVVVIPADMVHDVVEMAEAKDEGESTVREELLRGDSIGEVFERHGIL